MFEKTNENSWYYSSYHGKLCQAIETRTLWSETTYRVNPAKDRWYVLLDHKKAGE